MQFRTLLFFILITGINSDLFSVKQITIDECQERVRANYPAIAQYDIIEKSREFTISNANKIYLPQGTLIAQGTWQSDVPDIKLNIPGVNLPTIDKDQYSIVVDFSQTIWDGGRVSAHKRSLEANEELRKKELDNQFYALRERVNNIYFGILLIKEQLNQLEILEKELKRNYDNVQAYIQNGLANENDLNVIKIEQLKKTQHRINLESNLESYICILSVMTGEQFSSDIVFVKPDFSNIVISSEINRPELVMFKAQESAIESQKLLINAGLKPTIGAFAQGGYGKPGPDIFSNEFTPYFLGGVRLSWNFGNLYTFKNEKRIIELRQREINSHREIFLYNMDIVIPQQQIEIEKFRKTMQHDDEIINLQTQIRCAAELKVQDGTMTVSELMKEINAEEAAKQSKTLHEIEYLMSIYALKYITNHK